VEETQLLKIESDKSSKGGGKGAPMATIVGNLPVIIEETRVENEEQSEGSVSSQLLMT
jgi:hypothetical protein